MYALYLAYGTHYLTALLCFHALYLFLSLIMRVFVCLIITYKYVHLADIIIHNKLFTCLPTKSYLFRLLTYGMCFVLYQVS